MGRLDERGLTLLELMVAMLLLAIALIGLAASFPLAMYGVTTGGFQTTATLLAQEGMEVAKATPYDSLPALDTGGFVQVAGFPGFTRRITVAAGTPTATTTTVTVVVRFTGTAGANDTTVATIVSQ
jgi:prepilin-type N-terminal cleavage/methylation domain-containing protein